MSNELISGEMQMFKNFATTFFARRNAANACCEAESLTRSELQDLFRNEFEVHNRSAAEITARHAGRHAQALAA